MNNAPFEFPFPFPHHEDVAQIGKGLKASFGLRAVGSVQLCGTVPSFRRFSPCFESSAVHQFMHVTKRDEIPSFLHSIPREAIEYCEKAVLASVHAPKLRFSRNFRGKKLAVYPDPHNASVPIWTTIRGRTARTEGSLCRFRQGCKSSLKPLFVGSDLCSVSAVQFYDHAPFLAAETLGGAVLVAKDQSVCPVDEMDMEAVYKPRLGSSTEIAVDLAMNPVFPELCLLTSQSKLITMPLDACATSFSARLNLHQDAQNRDAAVLYGSHPRSVYIMTRNSLVEVDTRVAKLTSAVPRMSHSGMDALQSFIRAKQNPFLLAVSHDNGVSVFDTRYWSQPLHKFAGHLHGIELLAFVDTDRVVVGMNEKSQLFGIGLSPALPFLSPTFPPRTTLELDRAAGSCVFSDPSDPNGAFVVGVLLESGMLLSQMLSVDFDLDSQQMDLETPELSIEVPQSYLLDRNASKSSVPDARSTSSDACVPLHIETDVLDKVLTATSGCESFLSSESDVSVGDDILLPVPQEIAQQMSPEPRSSSWAFDGSSRLWIPPCLLGSAEVPPMIDIAQETAPPFSHRVVRLAARDFSSEYQRRKIKSGGTTSGSDSERRPGQALEKLRSERRRRIGSRYETSDASHLLLGQILHSQSEGAYDSASDPNRNSPRTLAPKRKRKRPERSVFDADDNNLLSSSSTSKPRRR
eukprot:ANDGO_07630.mRNA.1 hypothetical protein